MKKTKIVFEKDPSLDSIEITVRAPEKDAQVEDIIGRLCCEPPKTVTVTAQDGSLRRLSPADIVSVSVSGKQSRIVTEDGLYTVRQSLQSIEERLDRAGFVRISRYEMINLDKVQKFDFTLGGTLRLELAGGMETWASRRNISQIRRKLTEGGIR